ELNPVRLYTMTSCPNFTRRRDISSTAVSKPPYRGGSALIPTIAIRIQSPVYYLFSSPRVAKQGQHSKSFLGCMCDLVSSGILIQNGLNHKIPSSRAPGTG